MEYERYELEVILFDNYEVFTIGLASDADTGDGSGTGTHSIGPVDS